MPIKLLFQENHSYGTQLKNSHFLFKAEANCRIERSSVYADHTRSQILFQDAGSKSLHNITPSRVTVRAKRFLLEAELTVILLSFTLTVQSLSRR